jgi:hypothetical protein
VEFVRGLATSTRALDDDGALKRRRRDSSVKDAVDALGNGERVLVT